jgi:hypothetical protein
VGDFSISAEDESDFGVGESGGLKLLDEVAGFGEFAAEKFPPGGEVEEKVFDFDGGSGRFARFADGGDFSALDENFGCGGGGGWAGGQTEAGDAGDAGKGFAPEAKSSDGLEVGGGADFAGGVAFEAEQGIVAFHARAVVSHADEPDAPSGKIDFDAISAGIEAVFDEFFQDGSGAFDDFAGSDLAGDCIG